MYIPDTHTIVHAITEEQNRRTFPLAAAAMLWLAFMAVLLAATFTYNHKWYIYLAMLPVTGTAIYILRQCYVVLKAAPLQVAQSHVAAATLMHPAMQELQWNTVANLIQKVHQLEAVGYSHHPEYRNAFRHDLVRMQTFLHALQPYGIGLEPVQFTTETNHIRTRLEWMQAHHSHLQDNTTGIHFPFTPVVSAPKTLH